MHLWYLVYCPAGKYCGTHFTPKETEVKELVEDHKARKDTETWTQAFWLQVWRGKAPTQGRVLFYFSNDA